MSMLPQKGNAQLKYLNVFTQTFLLHQERREYPKYGDRQVLDEWDENQKESG